MLTGRHLAMFMQRTDQLYQGHRRRALAAGQALDFRLGDLRYYVSRNLGRHHCHYCCGPVEVETFNIDYKVPVERGGSFAFHNLAVVCKDCSRAKGSLDHFEYRELVGLLRTWATPIRRNFIARLQAGRDVLLKHYRHLPPP